MVALQDNWVDLVELPDVVDVREEKTGEVVLTVKPLSQGYGITLGNALRRVLMTSVGGFAVTSVRIEGVFHEYEAMSGVREDVNEIIMNIKSILFTKNTKTPSNFYIKANKKGPVTARDIRIENGGTILNKDLLICNLEKDGVEFNVEMVVEHGLGYRAAVPDEKKILGTIGLDAVFSPIKNVAFNVESARKGDIHGYEQLELRITTNGIIDGQSSVALAAKILQRQLDVFTNINAVEKEKEEEIEPEVEVGDINPSLLKRIDDMELSVRAFNCLKGENINYVGDLVQKTESDMLKMANFGKKSLTELRDNLKVLGLKFGMQIENWETIVASRKKEIENKKG